MYKKIAKGFRLILIQEILIILFFSLVIPPSIAQQQRRGVFLQDQIPGGAGGGENFGDTSDDEGGGGDTSLGLGGIGSSSSRGRVGQDSFGLSERALTYQVHVLGEVKRPGTFRVSPSMRVTDALQLAGNFKSGGSERFIQLRKPGQEKGRTIDLFEYKVFGALSQNPYLEDNVSIFVPLKKRAIEVEGPVRRPGVFELKSERTLLDVLKLTGGFTVGADKKNPIRIIRYGGNDNREIIEVAVDSDSYNHLELQDGDVIIIPHKFLVNHQFDYNLKKLPNDNIFYPSQENRVFVIGAVRLPGAFDFNQYYSVRQYLTIAGGTTTMAKNGQIKVVTVDGKTFKAKNGSYDRVVNPGDTIVVPEKSIPTSFYIGLLPTIASLGLSAAALFK